MRKKFVLAIAVALLSTGITGIYVTKAYSTCDSFNACVGAHHIPSGAGICMTFTDESDCTSYVINPCRNEEVVDGSCSGDSVKSTTEHCINPPDSTHSRDVEYDAYACSDQGAQEKLHQCPCESLGTKTITAASCDIVPGAPSCPE